MTEKNKVNYSINYRAWICLCLGGNPYVQIYCACLINVTAVWMDT